MRKFLSIILCVLLAPCICSCKEGIGNTEKLSIVTTIFPVYDWTRQMVGDNKNIDVTMLLDSGTDLHSFQPTADDIIKIATCDMFIYVGGESDKWVDDVLAEKQNSNMVIIKLLNLLSKDKKEELIKEGMEPEQKDGEENEIEYDEHIWLSLKNAYNLCGKISESLCNIDKANADSYKANTDAYLKQLDALDKSYSQVVLSGSKNTLVFGDRFPFRYMTDDYGIDYFAAFLGCSAESEASFKTVMFLANKVDELELSSIIKIEGSDGSLANTIKENTKLKTAEILTLDSMQSITSSQLDEGVTYINICEKNLEVIKKALS